LALAEQQVGRTLDGKIAALTSKEASQLISSLMNEAQPQIAPADEEPF
jgi:hypothetical protein